MTQGPTPRGRERRGATRVRGQARAVLRPSGPPTMPISVRATGDRVSEGHTRAVIDLALRLGEAMLVTGASVADTTAGVLRVCRAYGLTSVHADITYTSVTISFHRGVHRDPITVMRIVSRFGTDYSRLEALHTLVREICADPDDPGDVEDNLHELEYILEQPHAYRRGVIALAYAGMGAGVAAVLGGDLLLMLIVAATTVLIQQTQNRIARMGVSSFFGQVVGAMIASGTVVILLALRHDFPHNQWLAHFLPSIVVAANIVVLLAGMSVVTAAQDTLDGFYVTASARTYEVVLMTGGIVAGIVAMLSVAKHLGIQLPVVPPNVEAHSIVVRVLGSAFISASFAVSAYCGPVTISLSFLTGGLSYGIYLVIQSTVGFQQAMASGIATFVIGLLALRTARRFQVPSVAIMAAGVVPLMPGMAVYKGILYLVQDKNVNATSPSLLNAATVALALAVGSSLGTLMGRQLAAAEGSVAAAVLRRSVAATADE